MMLRNRAQIIGSPPRVRGKGFVVAVFRMRKGITPACAGKSEERLINNIALRDHPRVCGEKHS